MVLCLIAVLLSVALERMFRYQEYAERVAMESMVATLKRALALRAAGFMVSGRMERIPALARENPMAWLADPPGNYAGEFDAAREPELLIGAWYFDKDKEELVYRPRFTRFLESGPVGLPEIRFRASALVARTDSEPLPEVSELTIRPVRPYRWSAEP